VYGDFGMSPGFSSNSIPLSLLDEDYWSTLKVYFNVDSSLFQPPTSLPAEWVVGFWIRIRYECRDLATGSLIKVRDKYHAPASGFGGGDGGCECFDIIIRTVITTDSVAWVDIDGDLNAQAGGSSVSFTSSPLAAICNGCTAAFGPGFNPTPKEQVILLDDRGLCLHAAGGTGPYTYFVRSGVLPPGITLNPDTGCLEGTATGPGSGAVEFGVIDAVGEQAFVTCDVAASCRGQVSPAYGNRAF
jgi:hypothetical protein